MTLSIPGLGAPGSGQGRRRGPPGPTHGSAGGAGRDEGGVVRWPVFYWASLNFPSASFLFRAVCVASVSIAPELANVTAEGCRWTSSTPGPFLKCPSGSFHRRNMTRNGGGRGSLRRLVGGSLAYCMVLDTGTVGTDRQPDTDRQTGRQTV